MKFYDSNDFITLNGEKVLRKELMLVLLDYGDSFYDIIITHSNGFTFYEERGLRYFGRNLNFKKALFIQTKYNLKFKMIEAKKGKKLIG